MFSPRFAKCIVCAAVAVAICLFGADNSRTAAQAPPTASANAWQLDEALEQLGLHPHDPYLQYVALQLATRAGRSEDVYRLLGRQTAGLFGGNGRRASADLFSTFTGALAVQESLQLDTMRGERPGRNRREPAGAAVTVDKNGKVVPPKIVAKKALEKVAIEKFAGPGVESHPWAKMLGAKHPEVGVLANCVPDDFYFAEFRSIAKLNDVAGLSELWGGHIFTQALGEAKSQATLERIKKQLGMLELPPTAAEALDIEGIAVTGSDLFLAEGSDVTILVLSKKVPALLQLADGILKLRGNWAKGKHLDIEYTHFTSADGSVNVYAASPRPDLHVRGNSLTARSGPSVAWNPSPVKRPTASPSGGSARAWSFNISAPSCRAALPRKTASSTCRTPSFATWSGRRSSSLNGGASSFTTTCA